MEEVQRGFALTAENYYTPEANQYYMSVSQYKQFAGTYGKVYNIIDSRVRAAKPMILTTNLTMDEMMSQTDIRYWRIYDRIFGCCYPVEMVGPSLRMEKAAENFEQMGAMLE